MNIRKDRLRKCIVCGLSKPQNTMIRVVKEKDGNISIDESQKKNGRGAYICNDKESIKKAVEGKLLNRSLKTSVPDYVYKELESM